MTPDDALAGQVKLSRPAHAALAHAGIVTFAQLALRTWEEVGALHGVGPKSFPELEAALAARGLAFKR